MLGYMTNRFHHIHLQKTMQFIVMEKSAFELPPVEKKTTVDACYQINYVLPFSRCNPIANIVSRYFTRLQQYVGTQHRTA
jgi:hypothetical protein